MSSSGSRPGRSCIACRSRSCARTPCLMPTTNPRSQRCTPCRCTESAQDRHRPGRRPERPARPRPGSASPPLRAPPRGRSPRDRTSRRHGGERARGPRHGGVRHSARARGRCPPRGPCRGGDPWPPRSHPDRHRHRGGRDQRIGSRRPARRRALRSPPSSRVLRRPVRSCSRTPRAGSSARQFAPSLTAGETARGACSR